MDNIQKFSNHINILLHDTYTDWGRRVKMFLH
jgi:hypothetical protein